jgi:hypothetical protein
VNSSTPGRLLAHWRINRGCDFTASWSPCPRPGTCSSAPKICSLNCRGGARPQAISYSRVDTGRNPSAVPSSSKFPASHSRLGHGLIAQSYRPFSSSPLGRPTRLPGQAIFLPVATTMQNLNERDCHAKFNSQPCAQRYNLDDERNRSSSGSSSQRSLGSYSRAAFG